MGMLSTQFAKWGWTRDDAKWFWSRLVAVALAIATGAADPTGLFAQAGIALSPTWQHRIMLVCLIVVWIAGKQDSSRLPAGDPNVKTSRFTGTGGAAAVVLAVMLAGSMSCAGAGKFTPKTPQEAAEYSNAIATRTLSIIKDAGTLASDVRKTEQLLHAEHVVSDQAHRDFEGQRCEADAPKDCKESGFLKLQHLAEKAITKISQANVTVIDIAAAVQPLFDAAKDLSSFTVGGVLSYDTLLAVLRSALALVGV